MNGDFYYSMRKFKYQIRLFLKNRICISQVVSAKLYPFKLSVQTTIQE